MKTLSYFTALKRLGCGAEPFEPTIFSESEAAMETEKKQLCDLERRGHPGKATCEGRLLFEYSRDGRPFIRYVFSALLKQTFS